jgi:hypothetical protein
LAAAGVPRGGREFAKSLLALGSLRELGWQLSAQQRRSLDAEGSPIPWLTYPAVAWLAGRAELIRSVLEFGAGGSTAWFAGIGAEVLAIEHDEDWIQELRSRIDAPGVRIVHASADEVGYLRGLDAAGGMTFDLVVVDGIHRAACATAASRFMHETSLLCLDDSQRPEYAEVAAALHADGWRSIGFYGFAPIVSDLKETRFFSRRLDVWMDGAR